MIDDEKYSPYCKSCGACGEEECCSPLTCAYDRMIKNVPDGCNCYTYYFDLSFAYEFSRAIHQELFEKKSITYDEMMIIWNKIYDEVQIDREQIENNMEEK